MSLENKEGVEKKIAVFDICDTLYYSNTTHDFVAFLANRKFSLAKKFYYQLFNNKKLPVRYFFVLVSKISGFDIHKKINIGLLKGFSRNELEETAEDFVSDFLTNRQIKETQMLICNFRRQNIDVVLCSSSIEPVVKKVSEHLEVKSFFSSKLEFADEICTGKIEKEIADKKIAALQKSNIFPTFLCAVSDNFGDLSLLKAAKEQIAVVHSDKSFNFWKKQGVKIIDLR